MRLDSSGNLGLGVTPSAWESGAKVIQISTAGSGGTAGNAFSIWGRADTARFWTNAYFNGTNYIRLVAGVNPAIFATFADGSFIWGNAPTGAAGSTFTSANITTNMTLDNSGNLLVGTTSTLFGNASRLTIAQSTTTAANIFVNPPASYTGTSIISGSVTAAGTGWYHFAGQSGNGSTITTNNIFIFGNGNIQNTNNSYGAISDISLKENIIDATPKLDDLMKVQIRNYNLKSDPTHKQIGVIAQELETVFPSMIETDKDGIKGVKYSVFVPMLIKALQEQQTLIESLTQRIATLENK
jgi:hypothetical protein